jgi:hypothetical protein
MARVGRKRIRRKFVGLALRGFVACFACCAVLPLVGCTSGTLSGMQQSCKSTFGLLDKKKVSCTGSVDTVSGSPSLSVVEVGDRLDGAFRLKATIAVGRGMAKVRVTDLEDRQVGGEVSPGDSLRVVALVYPEEVPGSEDEERVEVQIRVAEGQEVRNLRYEATLVAQD